MLYNYLDYHRYSCALARMQTYLTKNINKFDNSLLAEAYNLFGKLAQTYYKLDYDPKAKTEGRPAYTYVHFVKGDSQKMPEWSTYSAPANYEFKVCLTTPEFRINEHHITFEGGYDNDGYPVVYASDNIHGCKKPRRTYDVRNIVHYLIEYIIVARIYLDRTYKAHKTAIARKNARRRNKAKSIKHRQRAIEDSPYSLKNLFGKQTLADIEKSKLQ